MFACRSDHASRLLPGLVLLVGFWGLGAAASPASAQPEEATPPPGIELMPDTVRIVDPVEADRGLDRLQITVPGEGTDTEHSIEISINRDRRSTGLVRFGENITIHEGEYVDGDVVVIGGTITNDGRIAGDCVAVGGNIVIGDRAVVNGDVVCVSGNLDIGESAQISGDAVSVWGNMDKALSANVRGDVVEVGGFSPVISVGPLWGVKSGGFAHEIWSLVRRAIWVAVLFGLSLLVFQLFPTRMDRMARTVSDNGWKAFFAGLAGWVLWLPVFVALLITIVGIPVALMLLFLTPFMVLLGYAAVAAVTGERIGSRFFPENASRTRALFFGLLALEGGVLLARLLGILGSIFDLFAGIFALFGYAVIFIASTIGFGALLMSRFRAPEDPLPGREAPTFPAPMSSGPGAPPAAPPAAAPPGG